MGAPANAHDRSIRQNGFQPEHVITRDAVLQTARPAGVRGNVAADEAFILAGRIWWIIQSFSFNCGLKIFGDHTWLHHRDKIGRVDFLDAIHSSQRKHNAAAHRHAPAHVTMAGSTRSHRDITRVGEAKERRDGFRAARLCDRIWFVGGEPFVAGMFGQNRWLKADFTSGKKPIQARELFIPGGNHRKPVKAVTRLIWEANWRKSALFAV